MLCRLHLLHCFSSTKGLSVGSAIDPSTMFLSLAPPFALDALDTGACFGGAVMFLPGQSLSFF